MTQHIKPTPRAFGRLEPLVNGLGFIDASACPHYDGDINRPNAYRQAIEDGMPSGFAADVGAALHFIGRELIEIVTSRENASAYRVELVNGRASETSLRTRYLGSSSAAADA